MAFEHSPKPNIWHANVNRSYDADGSTLYKKIFSRFTLGLGQNVLLNQCNLQ